MPRLELPRDGWAELREVDQIPRKHAKAYRAAFYASIAPAADDLDHPEMEEKAAARAAGIALLKAGGMSGVEAAVDALVLAIVSDWSFGPVDQATLDNMPDDAAEAIHERAVADGYIEKLMPDFGVNPDDSSPTGPSSA